MAFSTKSKLGEVLDHPEGAKIMEEYIPGCSTDPDPMIKVARGMTLLNISQLASDKLPASVLDELNEKLQAIADETIAVCRAQARRACAGTGPARRASFGLPRQG